MGSIAAAIFHEVIHCIQDVITEKLLGSGLKIWILHRRHPFFFLRHDLCDELVSFPQFNGLSSPKPGLQAARVSELADVDRRHT